ncbi:hypothetical protein MNBD_GAMMA16-2015 [hydrothermal vent metagenome]|uniref:Uncharacterized protein n=1 Tax=hydrothermal vent metagenome TaxID=652676 RepID=A0A3B1A585_9ZZZZ
MKSKFYQFSERISQNRLDFFFLVSVYLASFFYLFYAFLFNVYSILLIIVVLITELISILIFYSLRYSYLKILEYERKSINAKKNKLYRKYVKYMEFTNKKSFYFSVTLLPFILLFYSILVVFFNVVDDYLTVIAFANLMVIYYLYILKSAFFQLIKYESIIGYPEK